jgi:hypothetical protein
MRIDRRAAGEPDGRVNPDADCDANTDPITHSRAGCAIGGDRTV